MPNSTPYDLSHNQRHLLDLVRTHAPVSRAELSQLTGLTGGAITRITRDLIALKLIKEIKRRSGLRGQPALPLVIDGSGGLAIGVAFPYGRIDVVALDYSGAPVARASVPFEGRNDAQLEAAFTTLMAAFLPGISGRAHRIIGAGLALSGYTMSGSWNDIILPDGLKWMRVEALCKRLADTFQAAVFVENTANAAALGEYFSLHEAGVDDVIAVNLGHGVGVGTVLSGKVHRGMKGFAGEIGRLFPNHAPRPSAKDLLTALRASGKALETVDQIAESNSDDDPLTAAWIKRAAGQLVQPIQFIELLLSPQRIVLTGMLPEVILARLIDRLSPMLDEESARNWYPRAQLTPAALGTWSSAYGAAWQALQNESSRLS